MSDALLAGLFGDPDVAAAFGDRARLQRMLDVEAALAEAETAVGLIPADAAAIIRAEARAELYDAAAIASEARDAGNLAIPLVRHLTRRVEARDAVAARYVHWGATSQDVIDTALVLQLREAIPVVRRHLLRAAVSAAGHAERHAGTVMPGRTWLVHGTPTTFGLKAAGWLDALQRALTAVTSTTELALVLQFGGATGTLAAFGDRGPAVADALGSRLGLAVPAAPWHAHRDRLVSLACALGVAAGTLAKIARDIALLGQTEVGEAFEGAPEGHGGSSTMPHKRNPVRASVALAAGVRVPGLVATLMGAMAHEHERGLGGWQAEWETFPEIVRVTAGSARATADALDALAIDPARMRQNLSAAGGLAMAEAAAMALAPALGKRDAHAHVEAASRRAAAERRPLLDVLADDAVVAARFDRAALAQMLDPERYLGAARTFVRRILASWEGEPRG